MLSLPILQEAQEIYGYLPVEVQAIISRETGIPMEELTKFGGGSYLIADKTRPEVEA